MLVFCRYFDPETVGLDFEGMASDLEAAPEGSIIVLHGKQSSHATSMYLQHLNYAPSLWCVYVLSLLLVSGLQSGSLTGTLVKTVLSLYDTAVTIQTNMVHSGAKQLDRQHQSYVPALLLPVFACP